jgi:hypothetical protein
LSTGLSTKRADSCTEVINFSTVEAPSLWTLQGPHKDGGWPAQSH